MKAKCFKKILYVLILPVIITLTSCESEPVALTSAPTSITPEFAVKDGILVFETYESYLSVINTIAQLPDKERENWEKSNGFLSQSRIMNTIITKEAEFDSIAEILYAGTKLEDINKDEMHCKEYKDALNSGIIKLIHKNTEDEYWDLSLFSRSFANYVNSQGLYAIGDTLFHVSENSIRYVISKNISEDRQLFDNNDNSNVTRIITIVQNSDLKSASPGLISSNWKYNGKKRLNMQVDLRVYQTVRGTYKWTYYVFHDVYSAVQYKNFWGNWKYETDKTYLTVNGEWTIYAFPNPQHYSGTYSFYHIAANNLRTSINPQGGGIAPYQSYFILYPYESNSYIGGYEPKDFEPNFLNMTWTANAFNGGITATISR
jgi:hypothetical protein